ncbi:MAG: hypothetical protein JNG84_05490 [Archangium sp.]|nr:hypothetical protein [Archangium sp.]
MSRFRPLVALLSLAGCLHPQRASVLPLATPDDVTPVVRALAAQGYLPQLVDERSGLVATEWRQSGFCAHPRTPPKSSRSAMVSSRYLATVEGNRVTLRADNQCCLGETLSFGDLMMRGDCVARDGLTEDEQLQLDALGHRVAAAVGPR